MRNNALLFSRRQFRLDEAKMRNDFSLTSLMMLLMMFSQRCLDPPTDWGLFLKFQNSNLGVQREIMLENVSRYGLKLKTLLITIGDCYKKDTKTIMMRRRRMYKGTDNRPREIKSRNSRGKFKTKIPAKM